MMELLSTWGIPAAIIVGLFLAYLVFRSSKAAFLIFGVVISLVVILASFLLRFIGGGAVESKYAELNGSFTKIDPLAPVTAAIDELNYSSEQIQIGLLIAFVGLFFLWRILKFITKVLKSTKPVETDTKRRKRVMKSYGMKSMSDIRNLK